LEATERNPILSTRERVLIVADKNDAPETVLVPPAGIHTPGDTAIGRESPFMEVPADAAGNPDATRAAVERAQAGEYDKTLPAGVVPQHPDGSAKTPESADQAVKDEKAQADYVSGKTDKAPAPKER
jgi:hypothetical protein